MPEHHSHKLQQIKADLAQGNFEQALLGFEGTPLQNESYAILGNWEAIQQRNYEGVYHVGQYEVEQNKISLAIKNLIESLEFGHAPSLSPPPVKHSSSHRIWLLGLSVLPTIYLLGFLIWGLNSWNYHLGNMPAFHVQYFVAGILPFLILVGGWFGGKFVRKLLTQTWPEWINSSANLAVVFRLVFRLGFWGALILMLSDSLFPLPEVWKEVAIFTFVGISSFGDDKMGMGLGKLFRAIWVNYGIVAAILLGLVFYFDKLYPHLPQELGGVNPVCVQLDVIQENLALETRAILSSSNKDQERVVRTQALELYFKNEFVFVVKPQGSKRTVDALHLDADLVTNTQVCGE